MNEGASPSSPPRSTSTSPPPKCAICLCTCTNSCYSNTCRHIFCFTCLLEWSKVKAECPLCKQTFKSIIHNIKSTEEFDEHVITDPANRAFLENDNMIYLPPSPSRHFQFRTTFTVDSGGELAIQQMLLSHPLTNNVYNMAPDYILPRQSRFGRLRYPRRASSATSFRRLIYSSNMWVHSPPDMSGRYREVTPHFFRENPAARNRLVPWLNRELNALLYENTQQVMHLVDVIMEYLPRWHIRSRSFKRLLENYLTTKTEHFIHEFYNFMRSPYDMIGYDRHVVYSDRPQSPTYLISDAEDDSDVAIVNISEPITINNNPFRRPTIEVIEINSDSSHDSDVIIGDPPVPEVVLIDSDSDDDRKTPVPQNNNVNNDSDDHEVNRKPVFPLKIRLKRKRQSREKRSHKKRASKRHRSSSFGFSSSSSFESSDSDSSSNDSSYRRFKRKMKHKKSKLRSYKDRKGSKLRSKEKHKKNLKVVDTESTSNQDSDTNSSKILNINFDSDDSIPLSQIKNKELKKIRTEELQEAHGHASLTNTNPIQYLSLNPDVIDTSRPSCSQWNAVNIGPTSLMERLNNLPSTSASTTIVRPSTSNSEENSYSNSETASFYQNPLRHSLIHCDSNRFEPFNQLPRRFGSSYNVSSLPTIGSRYYRPDMNLPPLDHQYSCPDNTMFQFYPLRDVPSRVDVGVGTSTVHNGVKFMYENCCLNGLSGNNRLQSVIVKKENKDNLNTFCIVNNDSDTESM